MHNKTDLEVQTLYYWRLTQCAWGVLRAGSACRHIAEDVRDELELASLYAMSPRLKHQVENTLARFREAAA